MPPTIQTGSREDRERKRPGSEKRSELICKVKYSNTLPDIPFDPKFITYPFEPNRFVQYKPTSLERSYKYDLLTEHDLGVSIDLINPDTYKSFDVEPDFADEKLLEEDINAPGDGKGSRHQGNVSWLRRTEYISTEYNRFAQKSDRSEARVGFRIKQSMKDEEIYKDKDSQIEAIEKTFVEAREPIYKHYSKPGVKPVEILPIFPDYRLWRIPFAQVIFDSDPSDQSGKSNQMDEMSQAMIRGAVDENGEQFVAYFMPTEDTMNKRKRDDDDGLFYTPEEEYDYVLSREYNWNVKNKLSHGYEETYFFTFREDGIYYNELETRVRLSKRRKAAGTGVAKSRLVVKHRDLNEKEMKAQEARLTMLEPPQEEEEEEEIDMDLGGPQQNQSDEEFKSGSDDENKDDQADKKSDRSRSSSRSRSRSRSKSRSRSRSRSGSYSSRSSRSRSGSRSRSVSRSRSRSPSRSKSRSRSRSRSSSPSGSDRHSGSESDAGKKDAEEIFGSASSSDSD